MKLKESEISKIKENEDYKVVIEDARGKLFNGRFDNKGNELMTEEELTDLKSCFAYIDKDGNGDLELIELEGFFKKIRDLKLEKEFYKKIDFITNFPKLKNEYEALFKRIEFFIRTEFEVRIRTFRENDLNLDKMINWEEFLHNELFLRLNGLTFSSTIADFKNEIYVEEK